MQGRPGRVQERPAAYAKSPRPLRKGPADHRFSFIPGDRNVAEAVVRVLGVHTTKAIAWGCELFRALEEGGRSQRDARSTTTAGGRAAWRSG